MCVILSGWSVRSVPFLPSIQIGLTKRKSVGERSGGAFAVTQAGSFVKSFPEGPKIENIQDFAPGLKFSSDQPQIEIFNRD